MLVHLRGGTILSLTLWLAHLELGLAEARVRRASKMGANLRVRSMMVVVAGADREVGLRRCHCECELAVYIAMVLSLW